jgi:hypothetical protein
VGASMKPVDVLAFYVFLWRLELYRPSGDKQPILN